MAEYRNECHCPPGRCICLQIPGQVVRVEPKPDKFTWRDEDVAWDRAEDEPCERGTPGCSVRHTRDSECQTW